MQRTTQQKWLKTGAAIVIGFGLLVAVAALPTLNGPVRFLADAILWPFNGAETFARPETRLMSAIGGGVMAGWGLALWHLAGEGMARAPELARRIILASVWVWFVVDGAGSIAAGAPLNAALNLGFLAIFVLPLWRPAAPQTVA